MERPILFNGEMVRAILDGRKTQTRRVIKPQPIISENGWARWGYKYGAPKATSPKTCIWHEPTWKRERGTSPIDEHCPYGMPGDFLWVRETFAEYIMDGTIGYWYRATEEDFSPLFVSFGYSWKPSIFMPRRASRITLKIETIRIEQLHAITDNDAKAEGVMPVPFASGFDDNELHKVAFLQLWDSINAKRGYPVENNPFVWVIEFEVAA